MKEYGEKMSRKSTIQESGIWLKGNTHAHTTVSDGILSPDELVELYIKLGYDFTAITDHRIYGIHENLNCDQFIVLPGVELDIPIIDGRGFCHHVVGLGMPGMNKFNHGERITYDNNANICEIIKLLHEKGNLCILAHPSWSHVWPEVLDEISGIIGIEIYNHTCEINNGCGNSETWFDRILWSGLQCWNLACDDTHQMKHDYEGGFIKVKVKEKSIESILSALKEGSFFSSQGPIIKDFFIKDSVAIIECSHVKSILFYSDCMNGYAVNAIDEDLFLAEYLLCGNEKYIRACCVDHTGNKAWTQPIWI